MRRLDVGRKRKSEETETRDGTPTIYVVRSPSSGQQRCQKGLEPILQKKRAHRHACMRAAVAIGPLAGRTGLCHRVLPPEKMVFSTSMMRREMRQGKLCGGSGPMIHPRLTRTLSVLDDLAAFDGVHFFDKVEALGVGLGDQDGKIVGLDIENRRGKFVSHGRR